MQALSFFVVSGLFIANGNHRLAVAQFCYGVATLALFLS